MANGTGESDIGLERITGFFRNASIIVMVLHFYYSCYDAFLIWNLHWNITDLVLLNLSRTSLFSGYNTKFMVLGLLVLSLIGSKGRKDEKIKWQTLVFRIVFGLVFYFSHALFQIFSQS